MRRKMPKMTNGIALAVDEEEEGEEQSEPEKEEKLLHQVFGTSKSATVQ